MKLRNLIFFLFSFLFTISGISQDSIIVNPKVSKNYNFQIKLGATGSFFNTEISHFPKRGFDSSFRLGALFGAQINYFFKDDVFISGGLQVNSRGGQYRQKNNNVIVISDQGTENAYNRKVFILNYFEIPITVGYNVRKIFDKNYTKDKSPVFVSLGMIPAFNISSTFKQNSFSTSSGSGFGKANESFDSTTFDYANSFLLSGLFSVNFVIHQSKLGDFFNEISFSQSFADVYNIDFINSDNYKTKMSAISLNMGFRFN